MPSDNYIIPTSQLHSREEATEFRDGDAMDFRAASNNVTDFALYKAVKDAEAAAIAHSGTYEVVSSPAQLVQEDTNNVTTLRKDVIDSQLGIPEVNKGPNALQKVLGLLTGSNSSGDVLKFPKGRAFRQVTERELIERESQIGGMLFGPVSANDRREFFCLDQSTWMWHEENIDASSGLRASHTIRYEIHANGILKAYDGAQYSFLDGQELQNFVLATREYYRRVAVDVYGRNPRTQQRTDNVTDLSKYRKNPNDTSDSATLAA